MGGPVGLVAAFLSFESTRADLTDERGGQRRDREKDCDRHHLGDVGRQEAAARADMEVDVDGGAGQRHYHRQPHSPAGRDHEHAEQEDQTERFVGSDVGEQVDDRCLHDQQRTGDDIPRHSGGLLVPSTADSTQGRGGRDLTLSCEIDCQRRAATRGTDPNLGVATLNQTTTAPSSQAPSGEPTCARSTTYDKSYSGMIPEKHALSL